MGTPADAQGPLASARRTYGGDAGAPGRGPGPATPTPTSAWCAKWRLRGPRRDRAGRGRSSRRRQHATDEADRARIAASPPSATTEQPKDLSPALVVTGAADVRRDEGETYANKPGEAGVPVTSARFRGIVHDFVMLDALRDTHAALAAIALAAGTLRAAPHPA
ncbi:acetyl esterase/lipase [Streptomyces griseochromogenes]|uniref:Acetyl esterase/lipase n=1 Tax=Streptomyces griseochromogenes TaxID=68214 RepID=A0ABS4LR93_9ACTN|nr:acetyl esterase/lipase [Streptomyces griseochromogenes]